MMTDGKPNNEINITTPNDNDSSASHVENPSTDKDLELQQQKTTLNLNNRNIRLTLWSMIYIVITILQVVRVTLNQINITHNNAYPDECRTQSLSILSIAISSFTMLFWAAAIFLCVLLCSFCVCGRGTVGKIIISALFITGGALQLVLLIKGINFRCTAFETKEEEGYYKVKNIANKLFIAIFSIYLGIDVFKSIGDNIKIRVFIVAFLLSVQSFLDFLYANWKLNELKESFDTYSYYSTRGTDSYQYEWTAMVVSNFVVFFFMLIIMIFVVIYPILTKYTLILRIVSLLLILAQGISMYLHSMTRSSVGGNEAVAVSATLLMIYDIQYLTGHKSYNINVYAVDNIMEKGNELSKQLTVFNINNHYIRWTFWCLIFIVLSISKLHSYIVQTLDRMWVAHKQITFYNLGISGEVFVCVAAILVLLQLYMTQSAQLSKIVAFLFFVAAVLKLVFLARDTSNNCYDFHQYEEEYCRLCRVYSMASDTLFEVIFLIYFAVDLIKFVGDKIRVRVIIISILISAQSFLWFLYWCYEINIIRNDMVDYEPKYKYTLGTLVASHFILFFLCFIILLIAGYKLISTHNEPKMNSVMTKIIGILLLTSLGGSIIPVYLPFYLCIDNTCYIYFIQRSRCGQLIVPATILLVYEMQYL